MNTKACKDCQHYDPIIVGNGAQKGRRGWCATRSVYPNQEQPGQIFPAGVKRAAAGALASPFIVIGSDVVSHCTQFRAKP